MATHKSALKAHRQSQAHRLRNRAHKSRVRTQIKKIRRAIDSADADAAQGMLRETIALVDRSTKQGVIHRNAAARTKSRLTKAVRKISPPAR